ncbi:hypothetical protein [Actinoallomurus rhizosphaericola]|uniref:hypothetical protein n=1 Tax=Actinoallomurus rhizosphaericola TaxID=2952536 RepID=UPI002092546B|nr:hypothetical protein [Actinoallomurus rhizosphaericola]MCO5995030.1 hypothetical protein [Actinoallomurus rhizosphaericola]
MRVIRLRVAVFMTVAGVLCGGCNDDRAGHRPVGPPGTHAAPTVSASATPSSPTPSPSMRPRSFTGVMVRADGTRVTYRPAKVRHVVDEYSEYIKVAVTGPQTTLELSPDARILLRVPLAGDDPAAKSVTPATFAAALARNRDQLPRIGFDIRVGADGRITRLEQIYQP